MTRTLKFLILCLQTIHWTVAGPTLERLILNKNGRATFFPRYVARTSDGARISYVEPGDTATSTYIFDRTLDDDNRQTIMVGTLLNESGTPRLTRFSSRRTDSFRKFLSEEDGKPTPCAESHADGYKMYRTYYPLEIDGKRFDQILYEYCFNDEKLNTLYTYYQLDNPSLLKNPLLADEQNIEFKLTPPDFDTKKPASQQAEYYISQKYSGPSDYDPQPIAIPNFIPFAQWKITLFQWQNVAPMNTDLVKPWKRLLENIKSKLAQKTKPIKVYSGIYHKLRHDGKVENLDYRGTPIPLYWWITLSNEEKTQGISLIMHDYSYDSFEEKRDPLCEMSICKEVGLEEAIVPYGDDYNQAFIFCCPANTIPIEVDDFEDNIELLKFENEANDGDSEKGVQLGISLDQSYAG